MSISLSIQLGLDDLIADLEYARKGGELGRLALLAYCDARGWARQAGVLSVAEYSMAMFSDEPHQSREIFLAQVDHLIEELKRVRRTVIDPAGRSEPIHTRRGQSSSEAKLICM